MQVTPGPIDAYLTDHTVYILSDLILGLGNMDVAEQAHTARLKCQSMRHQYRL